MRLVELHGPQRALHVDVAETDALLQIRQIKAPRQKSRLPPGPSVDHSLSLHAPLLLLCNAEQKVMSVTEERKGQGWQQ